MSAEQQERALSGLRLLVAREVAPQALVLQRIASHVLGHPLQERRFPPEQPGHDLGIDNGRGQQAKMRNAEIAERAQGIVEVLPQPQGDRLNSGGFRRSAGLADEARRLGDAAVGQR